MLTLWFPASPVEEELREGRRERKRGRAREDGRRQIEKERRERGR